MLDWGKLVSQGRAKAPGVSWSDKESKAVNFIAQTLEIEMSEVAPYVRKGILTVEAYKKAQGRPGAVNPFLKLSKEDLLKKAEAIGLSVSPDATKEILAQMILEEKEKQAVAAKDKKQKAEAEKKAEAEAKAKKEAEEKADREKEAKAIADAEVAKKAKADAKEKAKKDKKEAKKNK